MDCVGTICSQISFGWSLFWTGARNCGLDIVLLIYHASLNISIIIIIDLYYSVAKALCLGEMRRMSLVQLSPSLLAITMIYNNVV